MPTAIIENPESESAPTMQRTVQILGFMVRLKSPIIPIHESVTTLL
ncbi:MAG: hypothetical protein ACK5AW_00645 [Pseudanabaena sp.]